MSRIPKVASRFKSTDDLPPMPSFPKPRLKLRRSKSFSELNVPKTNEIKKTTVFKKPIVKKPLLATTSTSSKEQKGVKRANTNNENEPIKPKIAKIPSWDFKSRFNQLNEKFGKMKDHHEFLEKENLQLKIDLKKAQEELCQEKMKTKILTSSEYELKQNKEIMTAELTKFKEKDINDTREIKTLREKLDAAENKLSKYVNLESEMVTLLEDLKEKNKSNEMLQNQLNAFKTEMEKSEMVRREQLNEILDLKGKIRVFCRLRPPLKEENQVDFHFMSETSFEIAKGDAKSEFSFDKVFNSRSTQEEIFKEVSFLVQSALDGHNVCILAYGQTGSGKTYTMQGAFEEENEGIIPRSVKLLFNLIEKYRLTNNEYSVQLSFLQVYNENVQDLLNLQEEKSLPIQFNEGRGITVQNLTLVDVESPQKFETYFKKALSHRSVEATFYNETSSRSHAVTKIYLNGENKTTGAKVKGSISLVDLAGSERLMSTNKDRINETKFINKSLSSLGTVMKLLYLKQKHIPYRNSKLTFLLQDSLGGNSKTLMIVNISPALASHGETISTLRFGAQVKEVKTNAVKNCSFSN